MCIENMNWDSLKNVIKQNVSTSHIYIYIYIYIYKQDLALNNQQWLICHKTQRNPNPLIFDWSTGVGYFDQTDTTLIIRRSADMYIIIIKSCRQHGYPWPSLATFPYRSSPPAGLLGYILCPHIAAVCKFGLVILLLLGHMWGSIVVRHLRARLCFSSSVRRVWLVWPV